MNYQISNLKFQIARPATASVVAFLSTLVVAATAAAQSSPPMLMALEPLAVQAGGPAAEHVVQARYNLNGTYRIFVTGAGVTGEAVVAPAKPAAAKPMEETKADDKKSAEAVKSEEKKPVAAAMPAAPETPKLTVRFKAEADALPGVREFRLATPQGLSSIGQLVVVRDPVVVEKGNNNTADKATVASLPVVLCGAIEAAEDVDYFRFPVKAGQSLTFHVRSARVEDKIHDLQAHVDPIIAVKNSAGVVLAASDNYFFGDPALGYTFTQDGDYYLEVRDVRYQGNVYWQYCVEVNDRPLLSTVLPSIVAAGKKTTVQPIGLNVAADAQAELDVPAGLAPGTHWLSPRVGKESLTPVPVVVTGLPIVAESKSPHGAADAPQDVALPIAVSGRLGAPGEVDRYAFAAKKGERFSFEVTARRNQSALDSILAVYDEKGKRLQEGDDYTWYKLATSDSFVEFFLAGADGRYVVEVRDLHQRGGDAFVYALTMQRSEPTFELHADGDKVLLAGDTGGCIFVRAIRKNGFAGEIELTVEGLPAGIKAECGRILADGLDGVIVFSAEKGIKPTAGQIRIIGRAVHKDADGKETKLSAVTNPWQETYMPGGGRGHFPVDTFFVAASNPLDVAKVAVSTNEIVLKPGESKQIEITIERSPGYDKAITLDLIHRHLNSKFGDCLPKGVTIDEKKSKTIISAKDVKGQITITAAADAPAVERQLVPVMAQGAINFAMKLSYCGEPLFITVAK